MLAHFRIVSVGVQQGVFMLKPPTITKAGKLTNDEIIQGEEFWHITAMGLFFWNMSLKFQVHS